MDSGVKCTTRLRDGEGGGEAFAAAGDKVGIADLPKRISVVVVYRGFS